MIFTQFNRTKMTLAVWDTANKSHIQPQHSMGKDKRMENQSGSKYSQSPKLVAFDCFFFFVFLFYRFIGTVVMIIYHLPD